MATDKPERKRFVTPPFRLSFPNLFVARKSSDDAEAKAKFGCSAIWTPKNFTERDKKLWLALMAELNRVSLDTFKKEWKNLPEGVKRGLRDGAAKEGLEGYGPGTRFANLTSNNKPGVVDITKDPDTGEFIDIGPEHGNADLIYPGCYCRATVNVYSYTKKGKGVAIGLFNVQKIKDGQRLDSRVAAKDDFDEDVDSQWMDGADDDGGDDSDFG
jgi:hypothetical protein